MACYIVFFTTYKAYMKRTRFVKNLDKMIIITVDYYYFERNLNIGLVVRINEYVLLYFKTQYGQNMYAL